MATLLRVAEAPTIHTPPSDALSDARRRVDPAPPVVTKASGGTAPIVLIAGHDDFTSGYVGAVLADFGMAVLGPFGSAAETLACVAHPDADAAILAVRLKDGPAWPVARALLRRRIPVVFLCDADADGLPTEFEAHRHLAGPFGGFQVAHLVREVIGAAAGGCGVPGMALPAA